MNGCRKGRWIGVPVVVLLEALPGKIYPEFKAQDPFPRISCPAWWRWRSSCGFTESRIRPLGRYRDEENPGPAALRCIHSIARSRRMQHRLTPGSGDEYIAPGASNPAAGNPHSTPPWRIDPASGHPDIPASIPSVVPRHPNPSGMQRWPLTFNNNGWRRPCMNNDLCVCCACGQCNSA
jgi:hypothetical protein